MAINKVVYAGKTLIDLTGDTVTASSLSLGTKAHDKAGNQIVGTLSVPTKEDDSYVDYNVLKDSSGNSIKDSSSREIDGRLIYKLA